MNTRAVPWQDDPAFPAYAFYGFDGQEKHGLTSSIQNESEAEMTAALARAFLKKYGNNETKVTVGVIAPYRAQVAMIRSRIDALMGKAGFHVHVATVDAYQGREMVSQLTLLTLTGSSIPLTLRNTVTDRYIVGSLNLLLCTTGCNHRLHHPVQYEW